MSTIRIVTCSETGMPLDIAKQYGIELIPYAVTFNGESWPETEIDAVGLYRSMRESKALPTTAHPSVGDYYERFKKLTEDGSTVIYIVLSSNYSKAMEAALSAKEQLPDRDIRIVDAKCATGQQGLLAILASEAAQKGATPEEIITMVEQAVKRTRVLMVFETLKYLARGGRIHKAQALAGTILQVKPVLTVDENGMTVPFGRVRTRSQGIDFIIRQMKKDVEANGSQSLRVVVEDSDEKEWASQLRERIEQEFTVSQLLQWTMTPIVGAHVGPGAVGASYYCE